MSCSHTPSGDAASALRIDDRWLTETARTLARGIATDLALDRLPILADALEDAGCDNFTLLNHLRSDDTHLVGCWALRRLLRTTLLLPGGVPLEFAYCPPGSFVMGGQGYRSHDNQRPVHSVKLTQGFYTGIHPLTQGQWRAVMGNNPSQFRGDQRPVEQVNWDDAKHFCQRAAEHVGQPVRLPTEAEWEYASRAGTTTEADYYPIARGETSDVGKSPENPWGLFDYLGNVYEWCEDLFDRGYYQRAPETDPVCRESDDDLRVCRGAMWATWGLKRRLSNRHPQSPSTCDSGTGFRVVFTAG